MLIIDVLVFTLAAITGVIVKHICIRTGKDHTDIRYYILPTLGLTAFLFLAGYTQEPTKFIEVFKEFNIYDKYFITLVCIALVSFVQIPGLMIDAFIQNLKEKKAVKQ